MMFVYVVTWHDKLKDVDIILQQLQVIIAESREDAIVMATAEFVTGGKLKGKDVKELKIKIRPF